MAVRKPLYYDSGNLREMSDAQIAQIKTRMFWLYVENPSVALSVVSSGGSLGSINDTRLQAGAANISVSATPTENETEEPSIVTVANSKINQTVASDIEPGSVNFITFPAYYTADGNVKSMTLQDMYDTFAYDVFNGGWITSDGSTVFSESLIDGGVVYTISSSNSIPDYTVEPGPDGSTIVPIYSDTRADPTQYSAGGITETQDQPITIQDYYLHKRDSISTAYTVPVRLTALTNIETPTTAAMDTVLSSVVRYLAQNETSYKIRYGWGINGSGTGNVCGSAMTDSRLDGTGDYQTLFVGADDYRAQEFPDGSAQVINVYTLKVRAE